MALSERHFFNWVLLGIGAVGVLANCVLLWTARQLTCHSRELRFAVALSLVDMGLSVLIITTSLVNNWGSGFAAFCAVKGPIDFVLLFLSLVLVAVIALERYCKVRGAAIPQAAWGGIAGVTAGYTALVGVVAARREFSTSMSGVDCTPVIDQSLLAAGVVFALGFCMFVSLAVALFAYLRILGLVRRARQTGYDPHSRHRKVGLRVGSISAIYLLLIAPSSVFIMLEGARHRVALHVLDVVITILNALVSIANPCLILFAHSLIFEQLTSAFKARVSECELDMFD